jgi:voltage-gated potassium channel
MPRFVIPSEEKFLHKISIAIALLLAIIIIATMVSIPYATSIGDALFKGINIAAHGNLEDIEDHKIFLLFLGIIGEIIQFYIIYVILEYVMEGKFKNLFMGARTMKRIKRLKGHSIICGGGRVGRGVAKELERMKRKYVIIEEDKEEAEKLLADGFLSLHGDCTEESVLAKASVQDANNFITCTGDDGTNILAILTAKELNTRMKISSRASHENIVPKLQHAGTKHIILPELLGAKEIAQGVLQDEMRNNNGE